MLRRGAINHDRREVTERQPLQHALFILAHEAAHYRLHANRKVNDFLGRSIGMLGGVSMEDTAPAFSPDGARLALPGKVGLRLLTLAAGAWQETRIPAPRLVSWSPDGRQLAVSDESAR